MRKLRAFTRVAAPLLVLVAIVATVFLTPVVSAYDPFATCADCVKDDSLTPGASNFKVRNIISVALQALGGVAVIMVVVGGIRLSSAHGDPSQVKAGRETILYALVGVAVAIVAYAVINYVVSFNW